jgi:hypothetical protein
MKRKAKTDTRAVPGFIKRRSRLSGQFRAHLIEMLESPAWRALSLSARRIVDRIEIELAHHGGNDNGKLPVTYEDFVEYGISLRLVAPAMREAEALGFIRITEHGRGGNADHRQPNLFFLTSVNGRDSRAQPPTHDWRKIKTIEEAEMIATEARSRQSPYAVARGKRQNQKQKTDATFSRVSMPQSDSETGKSPLPLSGSTGSLEKVAVLSRVWVGERSVGHPLSTADEPEWLPNVDRYLGHLKHTHEGLMAYVANVIDDQLRHCRMPAEWVGDAARPHRNVLFPQFIP